ncbi:MAG: phenylalanine--tRNA ligase subunit beta [Myxococcales bacterium]|nr:phenylalanine--tRNA ligase subunit beta [Myxococcales bacterium]
MRVPLSWLREFVPIGTNVDELVERLTMSGIEVETIEYIGVFSPKVIVGQITTCTVSPKDPKVHILTVSTPEPITVVSAAPNVAHGSGRVAVALPGATIIDRSKPGFAVRDVVLATLYGVSSNGLLCSDAELGIGHDHSGIRFFGDDAQIGAPALSVVPIDPSWEADVVLHLSILPNIARCQSIIGVAHEVAAIFGLQVTDLRDDAGPSIQSGPLDPILDDAGNCRRFSVAEVSDVTVGPSPAWLQRRLILAGMQPKNNVVDASNYVMLEMGQPTHTYDATKLTNRVLSVGPSKSGEKLRTIISDEQAEPMVLPSGILTIRSGDDPVAIAGVMGGKETSVDAQTSEILIESANFDLITIRRSQKQTKLFSESSARFSRGVDPALTDRAIRRILAILRFNSPLLRVHSVGDSKNISLDDFSITLSVSQINTTLGTQWSLSEIETPLRRAGLRCKPGTAADTLDVWIPTSRGDIREACDLIEEVARLVGYDRIPETMPTDPIPQATMDRAIRVREKARDAMVRLGYQEIMTYTLSSREVETALFAAHGVPESWVALELLNPVTVERSIGRTSLLAGLLGTLGLNARHTNGCHLFELGLVIHPQSSPSGGVILPKEPVHLAMVTSGPLTAPSMHEPEPRRADIADVIETIREFAHLLHLDKIEFEPATAPPFQQGACGKIVREGQTFGYFGLIHPQVLGRFDLGGRMVAGAELRLDALLAHAKDHATFREIPRFPGIDIDIAIIVPEEMLAGTIVTTATAAGGDLVCGVEIFDVYRGAQIQAGQKAIALRLKLNARSRTMQMEEAIDLRQRVAAALRAELNAVVRE